MIIVSNTSPISELAKVGRLTLLSDIYARIFIPPEVYHEVTSGSHPAVAAVRAAHWILVHPIASGEKVSAIRSATGLGLGECAALVLAEELGADRFIVMPWPLRESKKTIQRSLARSVERRSHRL